MRRRSRGRIPLIIICVTGIFLLLGFVVMSLWNAILPDVITSVKPISFWQSMGLLLLAKILFGGFGGWREKKRRWREGMHAKWQAMSPEEREQFKAQWRERCNWKSRWGREQSIPPEKGSEPIP